MKKALLLLPSAFLLLAGMALSGVHSPVETKAEGSDYTATSLPHDIDLNDTSESDIRNYYSSLNGQNLSGNDLLAALKPILKNGQNYHSYDSGNAIWQAYEIADRDWILSPATEITQGTYNPSTNKITGYSYGSNSTPKDNPYVHALYRNRGVSAANIHAWDHHGDNNGLDREHIWAKSRGFGKNNGVEFKGPGARGDLHHLLPGDSYVNSSTHSNYFYGFVSKSKIAEDAGQCYKINNTVVVDGNYRGTSSTKNSGTVFEPQDCDKGDIARACFYMVARYNNIAGDDDTIDGGNPNLFLNDTIDDSTIYSTASSAVSYGLLSDLLVWHKMDPVDEYEIHRNNLVYNNFEKNRNPFIDFPEWVDYIWGTADYDSVNHKSTNRSNTPTGTASPASDAINGYNESGPAECIRIEVADKVGEYEKGDAFIKPTIRAIFSNGTTSVATTDCTFTGFDMNTAGEQTVTVTHTSGRTTTFGITVYEKDTRFYTDTITLSTTGATGGYISWSDKSAGSSPARYAGKSAKGNEVILLNAGYSSQTGIIATTSGGNLHKFSLSWNASTKDGAAVEVYGRSTPYSSVTQLSDPEEVGTLIETVNAGDEDIHFASGKYPYLAIKPAGNKACYINSVSLTWAPAPVSLDLENFTDELGVGDPFSFGGTATMTYSNGATKDVTADCAFSGYDLSTPGITTVTVTCEGITTSYMVTVVANSDNVFQLVSDVSELRDGDQIILAYGDQALSTTQATNNRPGVDVTIADNKIQHDEEDGIEIITLEKSDQYWALKVSDDGYLYAASSSKNYLKTKIAQSLWAITISGNDATLISQEESITRNHLRYNPNSGSPIFSCYAETSDLAKPSIYKSYRSEADNYGHKFLTEYTSCDPGGSSSTINWSNAKTAYNDLTTTAKGILTSTPAGKSAYDYQKCVTLYDYIVGKYRTSTYEDFMSRDPAPLARSVNGLSESDRTPLIALACLFGLGAGVSTLAIFFIRRKHEA
ncbi:MAG: hypothetical protein E7179_04595 [Erysipelotrichaceae bacterium]|jgi:endonuclease I|nr:hypothetical protein [Erysipelotrichaceae bacterium]